MLLLSLMVLGFVAIFLLPLDFLPTVEAPFVTVRVDYPGSSRWRICASWSSLWKKRLPQASGVKKFALVCPGSVRGTSRGASRQTPAPGEAPAEPTPRTSFPRDGARRQPAGWSRRPPGGTRP
ncbi:MAG: efflux RND transporter permease subunit [bacterium]|nr:efflux RND transporter permease subunit [bacterium]